jgi:hypothetical protein
MLLSHIGAHAVHLERPAKNWSDADMHLLTALRILVTCSHGHIIAPHTLSIYGWK